MPDTPKGDPSAPGEVSLSPRPIDLAALERLFAEWMEGDAEEQSETFEALRKGLDENRPEGYKLFP